MINKKVNSTHFDAIEPFATKNFNNLVKEKVWVQVDPKDTKILAVTKNYRFKGNIKLSNLLWAIAFPVSINGTRQTAHSIWRWIVRLGSEKKGQRGSYI